MTKREIARIPYNDFESLWHSGLGKLYCERNPTTQTVKSLKNNIEQYKNQVVTHSLYGVALIGVAILTGIIIFYNYGKLTNNSTTGNPFLFSFGFFVCSIEQFRKSVKFYFCSEKLSKLDLSGFDAESYSPEINKLKIESIDWGLRTGCIVREGGSLTLKEDKQHLEDFFEYQMTE